MLHTVTIIQFFKSLEKKHQLDLKLLLSIAEFLTLLLIIPVSVFLNHYLSSPETPVKLIPYQFGIYIFFFIFLWFVFSHLTSMAVLPRAQRYISAGLIFFRGYFLIFMGMILVKLLFRLHEISFSFIFIHLHLSFLITLGMRVLTLHFLRIYRVSGYNKRNIVIIGDSCSYHLIEKFMNQKDWGFYISALITTSSFLKRKYGDKIPIIADTGNLSYILESQVVDELFYCKKKFNNAEVRHIARLTNEIGVVFRVQTNTSTLAPERFELKTLNETGKLALVDVPSRKLEHDIKTIVDVVFSGAALLLLSPFMVFIALMIKATSKGPVFFAQERVGLRGRKFLLFKFRTMVVDAEKQLAKLREQNEMDGPTFKLTNDPRITRIGKFLRKTGLDELPQLYNVVRGEMSLIGPRPPLESEVKEYERWQLRRLSVKPGITCTWQIMPHRNDIKFEKWMQMDLNYIDNWSLAKDIKLIFKTISSMIFATGR